MLSAYRPVLSKPGVPRLYASALLARLPQGMSSLAILLLVREATHSYAAAGIAVGAAAFSAAAMAPVQGRLIDRYGRALVLTPAALGQGIALVALVLAAHWGAHAAVLVALSALAGALLPTVAPSIRALLREVIDEPETRDSAYALESVVQEIIWILGPFLVALIVALTTPSVVLLALGVVCLAGTILFVTSPLASGRSAERRTGPRGSALASPGLRMLLGPMALMGFSLGAIEVGLPSLALHVGSRASAGVLLALWSLGSLLGGLWYGARTWQSSLLQRYRRLLLADVLLIAPLILVRSIPAGAVCALVAGLSIAPLFSCQYALVGQSVSEGSENEAFTWISSALVGGIAAGSAVAGAVIAIGGIGAPFAIGWLGIAAAALVAWAPRRRAFQPEIEPARARPLEGAAAR